MQMSEQSGREKLIAVARRIIDGRIGIIEGVRKITGLRFYVSNPEDELFLFIRGVESEADCFPIGRERDNYSPADLQRLDREAENYLSNIREDVMNSCKTIVEKYSAMGEQASRG